MMFVSRNYYSTQWSGVAITLSKINSSSYTDFDGFYGNMGSYQCSAKKSSDNKTVYWYFSGAPVSSDEPYYVMGVS